MRLARLPPKLVLASGNRGKLAEFQRLFASFGVEVIAQSALGIDAPEETGLSFVENALIKARHASRMSGLPALADDSGLCVDALGGAPGLYSARYAGTGAADAAHRAKLLDALADVPATERTARFVCVLALLQHPTDPSPWLAEGVWEGHIASAERGSCGFGYDAVFVPLNDCSRTAAELSAEEKDGLSHRGQALRVLASIMG